MAEEQGKGIQQIEGCEVIYDMGSGLVITKVPLDKVKEQDINARIMKNEMQDHLTANIKKRGQLESLPLFVLVDGKLEIISGHHRVKSARAAEMKEIIAIVDVSGLSRSKIAAKQLAHNAISGFDDDSTLREIVKMIDDVDDMIESFVGKEIMEEPLEQYDKMLSPAVQFDFKNVTFTFLPHQVNDMDILVKDLESKAPEIVGVASYEQCKEAYDQVIKTLNDAKAAVENSGTFSEIGKSGHAGASKGPDANSAEGKIDSIAKSYIEKNPTMSYVDALAKAWEDNPQLVLQYEEEAGI